MFELSIDLAQVQAYAQQVMNVVVPFVAIVMGLSFGATVMKFAIRETETKSPVMPTSEAAVKVAPKSAVEIWQESAETWRDRALKAQARVDEQNSDLCVIICVRDYILNLHWAIALSIVLIAGGLGVGWLWTHRSRHETISA